MVINEVRSRGNGSRESVSRGSIPNRRDVAAARAWPSHRWPWWRCQSPSFTGMYEKAGSTCAGLAVARTVEVGQPISAGDLVEVRVVLSPGLDPVPAGDEASVIGRRAAVSLVPGSLFYRGARYWVRAEGGLWSVWLSRPAKCRHQVSVRGHGRSCSAALEVAAHGHDRCRNPVAPAGTAARVHDGGLPRRAERHCARYCRGLHHRREVGLVVIGTQP